MKAKNCGQRRIPQVIKSSFARAFVLAGLLLCSAKAWAILPPPTWGGPTNVPIASWSFYDPTNWTSDQNEFPNSYTNIAYSYLGDFASLVVDTNIPAWLNFAYTDGVRTNIAFSSGTVTFWYGPNWATTNGGPGQWSQLIEVGELTTNASYGYWGFSVDPSGSNLWFVVQDGLGDTYGLSTPVLWTTNYFHFIALTYSSTNVSLYLDGQLATNDSGGLSLQPSAAAVAGGIYFGSDTNGLMQGLGYFNSVETYSYPLSSNDILKNFNWNNRIYSINPYNLFMANFTSAPATPGYGPMVDVITGPGFLTAVATNSTSCLTSTNVWLTNILTTVVGTNLNLMFTIAGGSNGVPYDVFANAALALGPSFGTNAAWAWMGQGYQCVTYTLTNLPLGTCYLILGTPYATTNSDLTDAYQLLVSKTNPSTPNSDLDGLPTGWEILLGLNPFISNFTSPSERSTYNYTPADWLNTISGVRSGTINTDNEGNVMSVSQ